ncbi:pilus assembly protein TadB [Allosaccharopolyspora coralli]|uniref:Pilus assembly protein TadB n=1 Tax=Allosaccharopolyspora coralli TaxID=2665642 RepID=A0A5Q3QFI7_9PSEU|nr:type II secretion system F family protein [Allosaccharopolyspora coralli]QGK70295.1 pilus assembly protein TadB [Allosaccharopolyspora coralli]
MLLLSLALGLLFGLGLVLAVRAVAGPAPMDLAAACAQLHQPHTGTGSRWGWRARTDRALHHLTRRAEHTAHPWLGVPTSDLDLLDRTPSNYVLHRLRSTATSTGIALVGGVILGALGIPGVLVLLLVVGAAVLGAMLPAWQVRDQARVRRQDARRGLAVYLDLVAQERATGRAPSQALREAADTGHHWLFTRLRYALAHADRIGQPPWDAVRDLGARLRITDLTDLADLAATAADGAAIYTSLRAKATSLRHSTLSDDKAEANARSERLTLPVTVLLVGFLLLVLYPTALRLLTA